MSDFYRRPYSKFGLIQVPSITFRLLIQSQIKYANYLLFSRIADVAISKRPLLFTVWMQLRLRSHQNFYEIFTRKQFLPTSAGKAQAQLHFCG